MKLEELRQLFRKHALLNAYRHGGRADPKAVMGKVLGERPDLRSRAKELLPLLEGIVREVNEIAWRELELEVSSLGILEKEEVAKEGAKRLPPLPKAEKGRVVTRFPPEPNGYPHIGHAKAAILDEEYARLYEGRFILRFDDTNPATEAQEYYDAILDGLRWLGVKPDEILYTSDHLEKLYEKAEELMRRGGAYVCTCSPESVRANRARGLECRCRGQDVGEALKLWKQMQEELEPNAAILRLKGDMRSPNTAMRDPTLFRILLDPHPRLGRRYRVWPTYDFAAPIEDSLGGVTHALRSKEYELRDEVYYRILEVLGLRRPLLIEFSRLELKGTPLAKRRLRPLLEKGLVEGWDDPRMPTLAGLRRRGFTPQAIREFVLSLGLTKVESEPTWHLLESLNRKILDPLAKRYFFVSHPVPLTIRGAPQKVLRLPLHPDGGLGWREVPASGRVYLSRVDVEGLKEGDEVRLMEFCNIRILKKGEDGLEAEFLGEELSPQLKKLQWVPESSASPFLLKVPGPLYLNGEPNPRSLVEVKGYAEPTLMKVGVGEVVQLIRVGFCRIDAEGVGILTHR